MNRFSTKILFCPISDEDGKGYINIANIEYYESDETDGMVIHLISGKVIHTTMSVKEFTDTLKNEAKPK